MFFLSSKSSDGLFNETDTNKTTGSSFLVFLPISNICCISIGLPLNLLIAGLIVTQERLHKPRHIFWLGVILSAIFAQLVSLNELFAFKIFPDYHPACVAFHLLVGIPYANLLLNVLFCLLDRYVAITYPIWHKKEMKIKWIVTAQLFGLIFISILFKVSYFVDGSFSEVSCCQEEEPHGKIVIFTLMTLVLLCLVAQLIIYFETKKHFIRQRLIQCPNLPRNVDLDQAVEIIEETSMNLPQITDRQHSDIVVHVNRQTIVKLEREAAWTLAFGVVSLVFISSPIFLAPLGILFCSQVYGDCTSSTWIIPYFRELILVHTIYKPVVYISRSRELFSA